MQSKSHNSIFNPHGLIRQGSIHATILEEQIKTATNVSEQHLCPVMARQRPYKGIEPRPWTQTSVVPSVIGQSEPRFYREQLCGFVSFHLGKHEYR